MYEKLRDILIEEMSINPNDITPDAEFIADLGFNSIELADLVFCCEDKFGVEIAGEDFRKFVTVGDVVSYLEAHAEN